MHVVRMKDDQGVERIYAARLLNRAEGILRFQFNGEELVIPAESVLDLVPVESPNDDQDAD